MLHRIKSSLIHLALVLCAITAVNAQIKQIQMKIDGYLCGN